MSSQENAGHVRNLPDPPAGMDQQLLEIRNVLVEDHAEAINELNVEEDSLRQNMDSCPVSGDAIFGGGFITILALRTRVEVETGKAQMLEDAVIGFDQGDYTLAIQHLRKQAKNHIEAVEGHPLTEQRELHRQATRYMDCADYLISLSDQS